MGTPVESFAASLPEDERKLLHGSIAFAFAVVASADSVVDKKEQQVVTKLREVARERLGADFAAEDPEAAKLASNFDWPQSAHVRKLAGILKRMPKDARVTYDQFIVELAVSIATASGGVLGFGEKLSNDEKYSIRRLISALDVQVEDADAKKRLGY